MTISFPLTMPTVPGPVSLEWLMDTRIARAESTFTGLVQKQKHAAQKWYVNITLPPMSGANAAEWIGFLLSLNGPEGTFLLGDNLAKTPRGGAGGAPKINGASQVGGALITDGWDASQTGILKAGDFIQLGTRLHRIKKDADSDGSGNATLDIWPDIRSPSPADDDTIITQGCKGIFELVENFTALYKWDASKVYDIAFQAVEAL